jgi:Leu/Phe-tRNA-protein transferase
MGTCLNVELKEQYEIRRQDAITYVIKYCAKERKSVTEALKDKIVQEVLKEVYHVNLCELDLPTQRKEYNV